MHRLESGSAMPKERQHEWQQCLAHAKKNGRHLDVRPLAAVHKVAILRWMSYWPWYFTWTMLKDPVRKAFLTIYHNIAERLQRVSDTAFRGVQADLPPEGEAASTQQTDGVLVEFGVDPTMWHSRTTSFVDAASKVKRA